MAVHFASAALSGAGFFQADLGDSAETSDALRVSATGTAVRESISIFGEVERAAIREIVRRVFDAIIPWVSEVWAWLHLEVTAVHDLIAPLYARFVALIVGFVLWLWDFFRHD